MSLKIPVTPSGIDSGTVRLVAQRLNHYATPGPTSTNTGKFLSQNTLRQMALLSDVAVAHLSSIVLLTVNGKLWTVPLFCSVRDMYQV